MCGNPTPDLRNFDLHYNIEVRSFPINLVRGCIENETLPYIDNLLFISISFEAEMKDEHSIFIVVFIQK